MNAKYFEENGFEDVHGSQFHKAVLNHAACIASNLMFDATHPDNNDGETEANAYHAIDVYKRQPFFLSLIPSARFHGRRLPWLRP